MSSNFLEIQNVTFTASKVNKVNKVNEINKVSKVSKVNKVNKVKNRNGRIGPAAKGLAAASVIDRKKTPGPTSPVSKGSCKKGKRLSRATRMATISVEKRPRRRGNWWKPR